MCVGVYVCVAAVVYQQAAPIRQRQLVGAHCKAAAAPHLGPSEFERQLGQGHIWEHRHLGDLW